MHFCDCDGSGAGVLNCRKMDAFSCWAEEPFSEGREAKLKQQGREKRQFGREDDVSLVNSLVGVVYV